MQVLCRSSRVRVAPRLVLCAVAGLFAGLPVACGDDPADKAVVPLPQAHAHNDYEHTQPLFDALAQGFCSVEADVHLRRGSLLIGHLALDLKAERTLEKLYLDPLRERVKANGGRVYPRGPRFYLLIDVKTDAKDTYAALDKVLAGYSDILSATRQGKYEEKAVTVVVSGNCDREAMKNQAVRYAGIDGRPEDLDSDVSSSLIPWVSARWGAEFRWDGTEPMPAAQKAKLGRFVARAHKHGRLVRFWATPEKQEVWKELLDAGVDLVNTDKLAELQQFLIKRQPNPPKP
jgi:hypothetical protein